MRKEVHHWYSHRTELDMPVAVYGHYGLPLLLFPTASADFEEYERFHLIGALKGLIEGGRIKVYSVDSINRHAWGAGSHVHPGHKAWMTQMYDEYLSQELIPFIFAHCDGHQPIITSGASMGAFWAANTLFKHPDLIEGMVGLHGVYDLEVYHEGYFDDCCYFNNPCAFLPHLHDEYHLPSLLGKKHIYIVTSYGKWENPEFSKKMARVLAERGISHRLDIWDNQWPHDWPSWRYMLPKYMDHIANHLLSL